MLLQIFYSRTQSLLSLRSITKLQLFSNFNPTVGSAPEAAHHLCQLASCFLALETFLSQATGTVSKGTRKDMLVNALWRGEVAGGEALTSAGLSVIPVVSQGAEWSTRTRVGQDEAGIAGRTGKGTLASASFT